jgi:uncharacterized protein involved in exopolysaccharide biosynthesis
MSSDSMPQSDDRQEGETVQRAVSRTEMLAFALRAARRHIVLSIAVGVAFCALATAVVLIIPPVYEANAKIFVAQSANLTAELSNPSRQSLAALDPMKGLSETVYRRENLAAIIRETKLLDEWERSRSPVLRVKDRLMETILGPLSEQEKVRVLVAVLEKQISVWSEDGTSILFRVEWREPELARRLAALVKRNFLRARNASEHAAITTAIAIVEDEVKRAAEAVEPALREVQQLREKHGRRSRSAEPVPAAAAVAAPALVPRSSERPRNENLPSSQALTARLEEVRRAMRDLKEPWQRRIAELRFQQAELRATYGPAHPSVIQQESKIREASAEPPELGRLVQEEKALLSALAGLAAARPAAAAVSVPRGARQSSPASEEPERASDGADDPEVSAALNRFLAALDRYNDLNNRLDAARLELTTAQAAFNYRYVTVLEPERSRHPIRPQRAALLLAGLGISLLVGFAAGGLKELASGRVVEGWQLRKLGLPVLAEVDLRSRREQ